MTDQPNRTAAPEAQASVPPSTASDDHSDKALAAPPDTPPDYNPDDYRWVPVRRRPRYDGWTEEKQRRFIEVLADTGIVGLAAKDVGMSREGAYRLRRSPHGQAFASAWEVARACAGSLLEDIAFERAIEGVEQNSYNNAGELVSSRIVYNDRLLTYLLSHLKPERYGREAQRAEASGSASAPTKGTPPQDAEPGLAQEAELDSALRDMEPQLPAPPEDMLDPDTLTYELEIAEDMDGELPRVLKEQREPKSEAQIRAEENAALDARGQAACEKMDRREKLTDEEFEDMCLFIDPSQRKIRRKPRGKPGRAR